jgi:hypothetical protein
MEEALPNLVNRQFCRSALLEAFKLACLASLLLSHIAKTASCQARQQNQREGKTQRESSSQEVRFQSQDATMKESKPRQVKIGGIQWYVDYDAAQKIAQTKNKPLWLHFGENPG